MALDFGGMAENLYICDVVCFGSGGYKSPEIRAYQEDVELNKKVEQMKAVAKRINKAIVEKDIEIKDGKLNINFWDYED